MCTPSPLKYTHTHTHTTNACITSDGLGVTASVSININFQELLKQREKLLMERLHRGFRKAESQLIAALEDRKGEVKVSACLFLLHELKDFFSFSFFFSSDFGVVAVGFQICFFALASKKQTNKQEQQTKQHLRREKKRGQEQQLQQ